MMNRREALLGMSAAALATVVPASGLAALFPPPSLSEGEGAAAQSASAAEGTLDDRLRHDLEILAPRVNSEEGVPVFLACVDLVPNGPSGKPARPVLTSLNAEVAAELRSGAAAWERIRPNAPANEVGKLIEVVAYRDFSSGGKEHTL